MTMVKYIWISSICCLPDAVQLNSVVLSFFSGYPVVPPTELLDASAELYISVIF